MSANFYELLKYAATGQASPSMTYYDKLRASTLMGGVVQTLTGIPPLTFKADGTPLISWSMKGNGSQQGTPTPDNPVMPTFCGVRTGNLVDIEKKTGTQTNHYYVTCALSQSESDSFVAALNNNEGPFSASCVSSNSAFSLEVIIYYTDNTTQGLRRDTTINFTPDRTKTIQKVGLRLRSDSTDYDGTYVEMTNFMLNTGSTALPYEPYGWSEKITCAGQTVPVYLGEVQTVRRVKKLVLDGTEDWALVGVDYIHGLYIDDAPIGNYEAQICSHFIHANSWSELQDTNNSSGISSLNRIVIHDESVRTSEDFKAFLAQQYAAGNPVTIWYVLAEPTTGIVNEPLCKISTYADELHSEDASVTIPTAKGQNTLTVDTPIQPSEMTIIFKG